MLGVSRQTINKALRKLENEGVLALHYAEIEIVDVGAGYHRLTNRNSGKSVEVAGGSTADGATPSGAASA